MENEIEADQSRHTTKCRGRKLMRKTLDAELSRKNLKGRLARLYKDTSKGKCVCGGGDEEG